MAVKPVVKIRDWKIEYRHMNGSWVGMYLRGTAIDHPRHRGEWPVRTSDIKRIYRTDRKFELRAETHNTIYVMEGLPNERAD